jgi:hypothetical protein
VLGRYQLWLGGVDHNDISVKNLMYDNFNDDHGILNDYDLARCWPFTIRRALHRDDSGIATASHGPGNMKYICTVVVVAML